MRLVQIRGSILPRRSLSKVSQGIRPVHKITSSHGRKYSTTEGSDQPGPAPAKTSIVEPVVINEDIGPADISSYLRPSQEGAALFPETTGMNLHELNAELTSLEARVQLLRNAVKYYKDNKRRRILVLGAGLSTGWLIRYLLSHSAKENWYIKVGDMDLKLAQERLKAAENASKSSSGLAFQFDVFNENQRRQEILEADMVISLLPAWMHDTVAEECIAMKKDLLTASYVSPKMKGMHEAAEKAGIILFNELGVDPGIDHMACMRDVDYINGRGGDLRAIESNTGGLVAPESNDNPWGYKFSWAPKNVVLAGSAGAKFIHHGYTKSIPYHKIFVREETIHVPGVGHLEAYPNRDSIKYRDTYGLTYVPTFFRGTFRYPGFARAWNIFVQLGMTDDTYRFAESEHMTYRQWINTFLFHRENDTVELKLAYYMNMSIDSPEMLKLRWLGVFEQKPIGLKNATSAEILQHLLERKWKMRSEDKDMIVMWNKYLWDDQDGIATETISHMVVKGNSKSDTAMAKTVGLPLAIAARLVMNNTITLTGVQIPTKKEIYQPILAELEEYGVKFETATRKLHATSQ